MASRWFGGYVSSLCSPQGCFGFPYLVTGYRVIVCSRLSCLPQTGARPKAGKTNLMDCSCLCSEVEILLKRTWP